MGSSPVQASPKYTPTHFLHLRKRESEYFLEPLLPYVFYEQIS